MFQAYIEELHTICADSVGVEFDYIVNIYVYVLAHGKTT